MLRRTFLQGATASVLAARFGTAFAQYQGSDKLSQEPAVIFNRNYRELREGKFKIIGAPIDLLRKYDLPRPPLPNSPIYPFWFDTFSRDLVFEDALFETIAVDNQTNPRFQQAKIPFATRYETSGNWSGAYVHPRGGNMSLDVAGIWRIPGVSATSGSTAACSIWVGLDGQRLYINSSLPQIGTWQQVDANGNTSYFGWYQWWVRGQAPISMLPKVPILVAEGDLVLCQVQVSGQSSAIVSMTKLGPMPQSWSWTIYPTPSPFTGQMPLVSGATAEWIVERPTVLGSDQLYGLPKFDPVIFAACAAEESLALGSSTDLQTLHGARFIQMYERRRDPQRTAFLSRPRYLLADDRDAFRVDYVG